MTHVFRCIPFILVGICCQLAPASARAGDANAKVESATAALNEIMSIPVKSIPQAMLADAQGVTKEDGSKAELWIWRTSQQSQR